MENIKYIDYHLQSAKMRDIDPANDMAVYLCGRYELSIEQRYWYAFLFSTCYCGPTAFYFYNEFPDFENVNVDRLERFWKANKHRCLFQTDRLRIKTSDEFVPTFESYKKWVGNRTQQERFYLLSTPFKASSYTNAYKDVQQIRNVGRFTTFIYLEMINLLTNFKCEPDTIDWKYAENCQAGLHYAAKQEEVDGFGDDQVLGIILKRLPKSNIFNIETTLCAYAKYQKGQRYIGYYIDRQKKEIEKMKESVPTGVCWRVLDQFRKEHYKSHPNLKEPI